MLHSNIVRICASNTKKIMMGLNISRKGKLLLHQSPPILEYQNILFFNRILYTIPQRRITYAIIFNLRSYVIIFSKFVSLKSNHGQPLLDAMP